MREQDSHGKNDPDKEMRVNRDEIPSSEDDVSSFPEDLSQDQFQALVEHLYDIQQTSVLDPLLQDEMRKRFLQDLSRIYYGCVETTIGTLSIAYKGRSLCFISREDEGTFLPKAEAFLGVRPMCNKQVSAPEDMVEHIQRAIKTNEVYQGILDFSSLTPFQQAVLEQAQHIPPGQRWSYAEVAWAIGHPKAGGAVARTLKNNPFSLLIPINRVICRKELRMQNGFEKKRKLRHTFKKKNYGSNLSRSKRHPE